MMGRGTVALATTIACACTCTGSAVAQSYAQRSFGFGSVLSDPQGVAVDPAGNLFLTGFNQATDSVVELPATPIGGYGPARVLPFGHALNGAGAIAVDTAGDVLVANQQLGTIIELPATPSGGYAAPTMLPFPPGSTNSPDGITVDPAGDVFLANYDANSVTELLAPSGRVVELPFGTSLHGPMGIAVDSAGDVFTASSTDNTVVELPANHAGGYDPPTVLPFGTSLDLPSGVAVDPAGDVFVPNANADTIVELPATAGGGHGAPVTLPFRGALGFPAGLAVDAAGQLFTLPAGPSPDGALEVLPFAPSVPLVNAPQLNPLRTAGRTTCPITCTYRPPARERLVDGAPAQAITTIGHHRQIIGTGTVRNGTLTMTFMRMTSGNYRIDLIQPRSHTQPLLIGHTALHVS